MGGEYIMELWKDKDYLREEFVDKRRTAREISIELGVNDSTVEYYLGKYNLYRLRGRTKFTCNDSKFNITNPIFNYYAGLIATDGYMDLPNNRVSLRLKNDGAEKLLNTLKDYFEFTGEVRVYKKSYDLTITSKKLIEELECMNIIGHRKTYKLKFPRKFSSKECERLFLRGVLDGDGNIKSPSKNRSGGQFRLVTASKDFIQGVINSINTNLRMDYQISIARVNGKEYPKLEMKIQDSLKFYEWIYKDYEEFRLDGKYNKYLQIR